jgi:HEAT repeat protein
MVFLTLAAPARPSAPDGGQAGAERAQIEAYLATHDVAAAAELRGFAAAPEKTLMAIASAGDAERLTRSRAVAALRLLPSPTVQDFLASLIEGKAKATDETDRLLLRRAAVALGWIGGSDAPELLALLFDNDAPEVRLDAALGISMTRAASASAILHKQLVVEPSPRVREQIQRQLTALGEEPPAPEKAPGPKKRQPTREPMRGGL